MPEPAGADSGSAIRVGYDVEDDVVWTCEITGHAADTQKVVEAQIISDAPGNVVVCARCVSAHTDCADDLLAHCIEGKPASEHVDTADLASDHRVVCGSVMRSRPIVGDIVIDRIAELQSEKTAAGLHRRVQVGRGKRQATGLSRSAAVR